MSELRPTLRLAGGIAILCGLAVIVALVVGSTFSRAADGERATDLVRSELSDEGLKVHRADFELVKDGVGQFYDEALPAFARQLGMTTTALEQSIATRYPAMANFGDPGIRSESLALGEGIVTNLEQHQADFEDADAIPLGWLPMTTAPWIGLFVGALLMVAGAWVTIRPARPARPALILIGIVGLVMVVAPLVTRFPQKADSADRLLATLNVTPAIAAHTRDVLEGAGAALAEMEERFYPNLAAELQATPQQLDAAIAESFPALDRLREQRTAVGERYERRVRIREGGLDIIPAAKRFPLDSTIWWVVIPGGVAVLASALGLALSSRDLQVKPPLDQD